MEVNEELPVGSTISSASDAVNTKINIIVCPTLGGQFEISVSPHETVETLRKKIGRHLQTPHERLNILFKEKLLAHGKMSEYNLQDGSKVTLLPAVESGFSSTVQGTQQSIIQAIESLSDSQIDDFLSGRSPLTLALRVGDHMMFVQLQLEQSVASQSNDSSSRSVSNHRQQPLFESRFPQRCSSTVTPHLPGSSSSAAAAAAAIRCSSASALDILNQKAASSRSTPLDQLASACTGLPRSSSKSSGATSSSPSSSKATASSSRAVDGRSLDNVSHRKPSTTCGKITSGVGPLSHHGPSGSRIVRHMQRLRRLCGAHQQCVVYSNRELASEISSIVHAAKHLSEPGTSGSSHRRSGKSSTRERAKASSTAAPQPSSQAPASGASIDSVTTHGPGIFSGTFSGSLHPNIQDSDGRPKRDPQTILQILTDLLSATTHYEGQTGNIGMLPQLFKDHFNKHSSSQNTSNQSSSNKEKQPSTSGVSSRHSRHHKHSGHRGHPPYPSNFTSPLHMSMVPPYHTYQHMLACGDKSLCGGSSRGADHHHHHHHGGHRGFSKCSNSYFNCQFPACLEGWYQHTSGRRSKKQAPIINLPRLHQLRQENGLTRQKMQMLREEMKLRRKRRQCRRQACGPYQKRVSGVDEENQLGLSLKSVASDSSVAASDRSIDMDIDDLQDYADERKSEVAHESPETVTV